MISFRPLVAALMLLAAVNAPAQDRYTPVDPMALGDRLLTLPTSHLADVGTLEVVFTHRFNQSLDEGEAWHSLFGLDSGANVGIGASYVPFRDFQVALMRSNVLDTFELSGKYLVVQQSQAIPVTATLRGGADIRTERDVEDRTSFFAQAIVSRQFGERVSLQVMPTWISNAGRGISGTVETALFDNAFNVPLGVACAISNRTSLVAELIPPNQDLPDDLDAGLGWAFGVKHVIGGHHFEVLLTNNSGTTTDQYVTGTFQGSPFSTSDLRLGFNIERRFGRRR